MKRIFVIFSVFATASCLAQAPCSRNAPLFSFDNANVGYGKEVRTLGSNPEFPFIKGMSSSDQVYAAIMKNQKRDTRGMKQLNNLMMDVGFANGVQDLTASSITEVRIPYGTEGNMGSGGYRYAYCKLDVDPSGTRAWKITGNSGGDCYVYILQKCGNAFFPNAGTKKTACVDVPVNLTADTKEVTLDGGKLAATSDKVYVYYHRKKHHRRPLAQEFADIPDGAHASNPIMINASKDLQALPQTYKVTVSTPGDNVLVCPDSTLSVTANIDVEKESEFTGNYPAASTKNYKEVSKHVYKRTARKMRKAERKERKVAHATALSVDVPVRS